MKRKACAAAAFGAVVFLAAAGALAQGTGIPPLPWVEVTRSAGQPVSIFCTPAGEGRAFTAVFAFGGIAVDGTLEIILWSDEPGYGEPIANYPAQDIWLETGAGTLAPCPGGTIADQDTDADGRTHWALPLRTGGCVDADAGQQVRIYVNGDAASSDALDLRINSADLNGDGFVNLTDGGAFTQDLYLHYDYRSDFVWDGVINVSDAGLMAQALGDQCP